MNPKVTIVVPVYKVEKYIDQCVQSLCSQTYKNLEILLVDDGSPDRCPQICDEYAAKDKRIKVIHQKNKGLSKAREAGLKIAEGEFVTFVDSDDYIEAAMIETMVAAGEKHKADIVICDWQTFSDEFSEKEIHTQNISNDASMEQIRDEYLIDKYPNFMWNKLFSKGLFQGVTFPGNMIYEDLFINAEMFCRCRKVYYVSEPFYCYRMHASFTNTSNKIRRKLGLFLAWREHERVCEKYGLTMPLSACRLWAQEAVISLLVLHSANPMLSQEEFQDARDYLKECETHPAENLSLKHRFEWWTLKNSQGLAKLCGQLSLWGDKCQQLRKYGI